MRNTKRELSWSIKREILTEFSWSLYRSGYPEQFRLEVISSVISAYEMQCARADRHLDKEKEETPGQDFLVPPKGCSGVLPRHPRAGAGHGHPRDCWWGGREAGPDSKNNWDRRTDTEKPAGQNRLVWLPDVGLQSLWEWSRGWLTHQERLCLQQNLQGVWEGGNQCQVLWRIWSEWIQSDERDAREIRTNNIKNAFSKHFQLKHPDRVGEPSTFSYKVERTFRSCLDRQVQEGVRITLDESDELLNSKSEYHQPGVTRVITTREVAERTGGR